MPELEEEENLSLNENLARLLKFLTKRRWWIFLPFVGVTLLTNAVLAVLPNRYTSSATLSWCSSRSHSAMLSQTAPQTLALRFRQ